MSAPSEDRSNCVHGYQVEDCDTCKPESELAQSPGSPAPKWYSPEEIRHHLIRSRYAPEIADELCVDYAANLQAAFMKGLEIGKRESVASSELLSAAALVSTRWLEGKLTKHEMGRLGRACVAAMRAGIPLDSSSPFLNPMTKADNS
jgi:hypothetical protein